jgi:pimeloyl-ACP methyl ester carboxylesterase
MPPPLPELEGVSHSFHEARGVRFHVAEAGEGEPLVLLHGWPQNWWCWHKVIPALAESGHRVIAPDLRGYGWSEVTPDGYEKQNFVRDVLALLDGMGLERVQLMGHDWGAMTGFMACIEHPNRFERFIALGIPHPFREPHPRAALDIWRLYYQVILATPVIGAALVQRAPGFVERVLKGGTVRKDAFTDRDIEIYSQTLDAHATVQTYRSFLLRELGPLIGGRWRRRLSVPTRLMVGDGDPVATPTTVPGYEKYADDMDAEVLRGVGHFVPEEAPDDVLRLARSFLRPSRARAAPAT